MTLAVCLICIFLVPLVLAGLGLVHQGLGRSRSAAHAMLATMAGVSIAAIVFVLLGSAWAGFPGGPFHSAYLGGVRWNWLGAEPFFARYAVEGGLYPSLVLCLQMFAVCVAAVVPISTGNDRWRLMAICVFTAFLAGAVYPLFAHWVWGGGWLSQLTASFGLPGFVDAGGAGVVQVVGGFAALSVAWVVGPRQGKYNDGMAIAIPGHNIVLVLFGCLLALVGWIGLDAAGSLLFYSAAPPQLVMVAINAMLSASAGCLAAVVTTRLRYRKADASLSANGWIAGLVAGSAACGMVSPLAAVFTGLVAGGLVTFLVEALELKLLVDDPSGSIPVHAGAGLWGLIACGLFAQTSAPRMALLLSQMIGVATLLGVILPLIHIGNLLLNKLVTYRVDADGDWQGMDIRELGAGAYPEFVMHADEFVPRS
jgi:Amt family ammonium transporter